MLPRVALHLYTGESYTLVSYNMINILLKHTVENYDAWKPGFDANDSTRRENGQVGYELFRVSDDPNEIVMMMEWDTAENAQRFLEESDVRERMAELGVVGEPEIYFLDSIESKMPSTPSA